MAVTQGMVKIYAIKDNYKKSFSYMASNFCNKLPTNVNEAKSLDSFKQNYMLVEIILLGPNALPTDVLCGDIYVHIYFIAVALLKC